MGPTSAGFSSFAVVIPLCWPERPFQDCTTPLNLIFEEGKRPQEGAVWSIISRWMLESIDYDLESALCHFSSLASSSSIWAHSLRNSINTRYNRLRTSSSPCGTFFGLTTDDRQRVNFADWVGRGRRGEGGIVPNLLPYRLAAWFSKRLRGGMIGCSHHKPVVACQAPFSPTSQVGHPSNGKRRSTENLLMLLFHFLPQIWDHFHNKGQISPCIN